MVSVVVFMCGFYPSGSRLEARELLARVDVEERVGLVVEGHFDDLQGRVPAVDLALAARKELLQRRQHRAAHEREHGMCLLARLRHRELGILALERATQPRDEIGGK